MRRRRNSATDLQPGRIMTVEQALDYLRQHRLPLHYDRHSGVDIWTPNYKVPISLRRAIVKHRQQLLNLMSQGDARACPTPVLHRCNWRYAGQGHYVCEMCRQLEPSIQTATRYVVAA